MKIARAIIFGLLCAACSDLPVTGDGVVLLEVTTPPSLTLRQGDSITLAARALDQQGEEVAAAVTWATPDTTITVSETGVVTAVTASGTGRVQASVGTLRSNILTFSLQPQPTVLRANR
jgi:hypothetical protein